MTDFVLIVVIVGCEIPKASGKNQFCPSLPLFQTCRGHTLGGGPNRGREIITIQTEK